MLNRFTEQRKRRINMTEEKYKEITAAGRVLCNYCQNTECEKCQVTRLLDDAALDAVEDGVIDDLER